MPTHQIALIILAIALAAVVITLMVKAVIWIGHDARARGIERVWPLQLLAVIEFPWPWLMYYLTVRKMDARKEACGARRDDNATASA
jgi:hypothetical protein